MLILRCVPGQTFGTALEDARRRDFTTNSMFFNINRGVIEDLTEVGFKDLQDGLLRTPLPPQTTFHDDPLRVMRAVRFAGRFGFALHPDITAAIANPDVQVSSCLVAVDLFWRPSSALFLWS